MNPFFEISSPWPARTASVCAAMLVLALSLLVFFVVLPPVMVRPDGGAVTLYLLPLAQELRTIARHADCGTGIAGFLAVDCRADAIWRVVSQPTVASVLLPRSILIVTATIVAAWNAFDSVSQSTPKSDRLMHVRGRRLRQDAVARRVLPPVSTSG